MQCPRHCIRILQGKRKRCSSKNLLDLACVFMYVTVSMSTTCSNFKLLPVGLSTSTRNINKCPAAYAELFLCLFKAYQTQTHAGTRAYTKAEMKGVCRLYRSRQGPLGHYLPYPTMKMCCGVLQHAAAATTAACRSRTRPPWSLSAMPPNVVVLVRFNTQLQQLQPSHLSLVPSDHCLYYPPISLRCSLLQHTAAAKTAAYRSRTRPPWSLPLVTPDVGLTAELCGSIMAGVRGGG